MASERIRICCLSDLHGHLPEVPDCDLLLLAGDYCLNSRNTYWYRTAFAGWLERLSRRMKIVGVAGNHDFFLEQYPDEARRLAWSYLLDSSIEWRGWKIHGSPWQPRFHDWAFNADEPRLARIWQAIPADTDILLLHGPPRGYGDLVRASNVHVGSPSLRERIEQIQPQLVVCGHIHEGHGQYVLNSTLLVNASHVNERYEPAHPPSIVELPHEQETAGNH